MVVVQASSTSGATPAFIHSLYLERKNKAQKWLAAATMIRKVYNGEWSTVLPELESQERTSVANLIQSGTDQHAQRIASVMPNHYFPPERNSRAARDRAMDRRMVVEAWHYQNRMPLKFRRRARHLIGYGIAPVYLRPGEDGIPVWDLADPLTTFPAPCAPDDFVPPDCIFAFTRSWKWLNSHYDISRKLPLSESCQLDTMLDVLLYCDDTEQVMIAIGKDTEGASQPSVLLQRVPNLTGEPTVVVPGRITLDRLQGQFDQMVGMYESQGLLWAMHLQALKRAIFPETWVEARPNESANVISYADPVQGDIGVIEGGNLQTYRADPGVQTLQAMDRSERAMRLTGAIPSEFGGESSSNIRTGKRGQQVLSASVDYPIQEHQDILAASLEAENRIAIAISKAYWPNTERTLLVPFGDGQVTYTPAQLFTTAVHRVAYAYSGTDVNGLVIEGLQRVGAGTLSNQGFMELDPMITDPIFEHQRVIAEGVEKALLQSIQSQAADPQGPFQPADLALLMGYLTDQKMGLAEAVAKLQAVIQKRQQAAAQGQLTDQQMQPGLAMPGAPGTPQAAQAPAAIGAPGPSQQNLAQLMQTLRGANRGPGQPAMTPGAA